MERLFQSLPAAQGERCCCSAETVSCRVDRRKRDGMERQHPSIPLHRNTRAPDTAARRVKSPALALTFCKPVGNAKTNNKTAPNLRPTQQSESVGWAPGRRSCTVSSGCVLRQKQPFEQESESPDQSQWQGRITIFFMLKF